MNNLQRKNGDDDRVFTLILPEKIDSPIVLTSSIQDNMLQNEERIVIHITF